MSNAVQAVKDVADDITLSNEEDSVAVYLEKSPFDVPNENFMAYKIKETASDICRVVKYAKEFGLS